MGKKKQIIAISTSNGNRLIFQSVNEASKTIGLNRSTISNALNKDKPAGGYTFMPYFSQEKQVGRTKKEDSRWSYTYFYEKKNNKPHSEKKAYFDPRGLIFVNYNFHSDMKDGICPDFTTMQRKLQSRLNKQYESSIVAYDGCVSRKNNSNFYVNAQVMVKVKPKTIPSEKTFKNLERLIKENVFYEDENGKNTYNIERLGNKKYNKQYEVVREKCGERIKHNKRHLNIKCTNQTTGEVIIAATAKEAAEKTGCGYACIIRALNGKVKSTGGWSFAD